MTIGRLTIRRAVIPALLFAQGLLVLIEAVHLKELNGRETSAYRGVERVVTATHFARQAWQPSSATNLSKQGLSPLEVARASYKDLQGSLPLGFEANQGQVDRRVKYLSHGNGFTVFLTADEAVLTVERTAKSKAGARGLASTDGKGRDSTPKSADREVKVVKMRLEGADVASQVSGLGELEGRSNYFTGKDSARWHTGIRNYERVKYSAVYPGVDLIYHGNQRQLEYDFAVAPGADPKNITLVFDYMRPTQHGLGHQPAVARAPLSIDSQGNLVVRADDGELRFQKPIIYQQTAEDGSAGSADKRTLRGHYVLRGRGRVGFRVDGAYDASRTLIVDPVLQYSTYLGGGQDDVGETIAVDSAGSAYVTGYTSSTNFPTASPLQASCASCSLKLPAADAFVTKFSSDGSKLVYSTFLGGGALDEGLGIAVDASGNAYVAGLTQSADFPTVSPLSGHSSLQGSQDAFVAKLNPAGSALVYSTYLGGSSVDQAYAIAVDSAGNAYVTGTTQSNDFPTQTPLPAPNNALQGIQDAFVAKLNPAGSALIYSTYLGGSEADTGFGVAVDPAGSAYVAGQTYSNNFPTVGAFQGTFGGGADAFVSKLSPDGTQLVYSTYLGGTQLDGASGIALGPSGGAFVAGSTSSSDFPVTSGSLQTTFAGGGSDGFVTELNSGGSGLIFSTYLGGSGQDAIDGVAVDSAGKASVVGFTSSTNFPTANPVQPAYGGNQDAFVARLVPSGCGISFSTYLGGHASDIGAGVAVDASGNTYVTGQTFSNDFPTHTPFQAITGGGFDAFVAMMTAFTAPVVCRSQSSLSFPPQPLTTMSSAQMITVTNGGDAALDISNVAVTGNFSETNTCGSSVVPGANCNVSVVFLPRAVGTETGNVTITDNAAGSPQQIAVSGVGTDFSMSVSPAKATVSAGQTATYPLIVTPLAGFDATIALTCSGAPQNSTCSVSPASVASSQGTPVAANVTVTTASRSTVMPVVGPHRTQPRTPLDQWPSWLLLLFSMLLLSGVAQVVGRRRSWRWARLPLAIPLLGGIVLSLLLWTACGVGGKPSGTPAGTYSLTVTGTVGTLTHSVAATLTVQ